MVKQYNQQSINPFVNPFYHQMLQDNTVASTDHSKPELDQPKEPIQPSVIPPEKPASAGPKLPSFN